MRGLLRVCIFLDLWIGIEVDCFIAGFFILVRMIIIEIDIRRNKWENENSYL